MRAVENIAKYRSNVEVRQWDIFSLAEDMVRMAYTIR
jgi:hypothetical protein